MSEPIRLGTRGSALARAQSALVAEQLRRHTARPVELVEIATEGDRSAAALHTLGGTGVFVTAIRAALLDGRVDCAVHSLKDLPVAPAPGLTLAAVPPRVDPRDVLVAAGGATLADLAPGTAIGTGSPRRAVQLRALGFGLEPVPVRGNVDTRLRKVHDGELPAVVLARAGLLRLGRADEATDVLDPLLMLPAPGQGALAVECRDDDAALGAALRALDDADTRAAVTAERTLLAVLEAGCAAPVGALAEVVAGDDGDELFVRACYAAADDAEVVRATATGDVSDPKTVGTRLARELLELASVPMWEPS